MSNLKTLDAVTGKHDNYAWVSIFNELFDSKYTTLHQLAGWFDIEDSEIWEKYVLDIVQEYIKEGHYIFEAGCGCGAILDPIQKHFKNVTISGVDGSDISLIYAKEFRIENCGKKH
ncbi:9034_t:CDS:1 [Dentiscutata heterogama]|uniref:9034_t:CDS:1 n=1 Tax=Dentiscutata heterogama TaxID=1316150 RepID=A0ACA9MI02_9GLOM|nr:9034_t:CDS:1 [Dentiscutata heterogama]